ncbi:serine/threonine protein kinase [Nocardiopsis suaedae]|uniref:Serine/threonine-protein kinase n=1 Tax=Nocardiopsis suaedae TaxID=3018444 RepID=A0ABT4TH15_9ACTN|nr:serine/threonine-protein kinase [Nocardiopsis suaedae]MDA2803998.1 serine/threonine-protein kinase [Nocardiopsis suaedae]
MTDGPRRLGGFTLYGELGRGGFGTVYLGVDDEGRQAAVKELHPHMLEDAHARELFRRELDAARGVRGFCTASVLEADADSERPWIASEYVEGPTLLAEVRDNGPRHGADLERLAVHTATALVAIHAAGVVHRDFKPDNILLAEDGPRVIDFGVARLAEAGAASTAAVGTVGYMAPEQLQGSRIDDRADVFAWGATMVYAGSGGQAFPGPNVGARMLRVIKGPPETGALSGYLRTVVLHCLVKDPAERPSAREVLDMLTGAEQVPPAPDPGTAAAGPTVRVAPPRREAAAELETQAVPAAGVAPPRPRPAPDRWSDPTGTPSGGGAPGGPDPRARLAAAERHLLTGDGGAAQEPLQQAIAGFDQAGDDGRADYARILLGDLHNVNGRHEDAWRLLESLRERFERAGKRVHLARCLRGMALLDHGQVWDGRSGGGLGSLVGGLLSRRGADPWRAEARLELAERSLLLFHELNHGRESARTRLVLGQVLSEVGEADRALDAFSQAVSGFEALGDRWWEARARRITAQTRFHAVMESQMAVGVYTGPPREGKELSLVLDHARRAVRLCGKAGDQRGRIAAQVLLARVVWATLGHEGAQALQAAEVPSSATPSSGPGSTAQTAWYERMTTSDEVEALLETSAAEARSQGLEELAAQARLWQERLFHESPGVHVQGWELHKKPQEVPFEESGLTRGDRCAV